MEFRKRQRRMKAWIVLGAALFAILLFYVYVNAQLRPALREMANVRVKALVSDAMYGSVLDKIAEGALDEPFTRVQGEEGHVNYTEMNSRALTRFAAECAKLAQERLIAYGKQGIDVPVGTASGVSLFAGVGPGVHMSFYPETNTQAYFSSEFQSAGINQTLHRIMLRLEAQVAVALPGETLYIVSFVDVPVAEQVIVGQVPDTYASFGFEKGALNLVPNE